MVKVTERNLEKITSYFANNLKRHGNTIGFPHTLSKEEI